MSRTCLALALFVSLTSVACSRPRAAEREQADPESRLHVRTSAVKRDQVRRVIEVVGTLQAFDAVTISAEVEGKVSRILADLGDRVSQGQVLVELDREKLQYSLDQRRAQLAQAKAKYGTDGDDGGAQPPAEATPSVRKAAAELAQAEQNWKRADELSRRSLVSRQQLDDAQAKYRTAKASYDAALQDARNLSADIEASEANLRLADRELRDASIRAPFDGFIAQRLVSPGQFVKLQSAVMSLVKVNPLKLTIEVPEHFAPWVNVSQRVEVRVDAFPDRRLAGTISRISPAVNQQTRAFPLEALLPNADGSLKPGTFARVRIESAQVDSVLTLPVTALQYRYGVNRVFVVKGDHVMSREVKLGDRLGDLVEVLSGVDASDTVAVSEVERLADGLRVRTERAE